MLVLQFPLSYDCEPLLQCCHRDLLKPSFYWIEYRLHSVAVNERWSRRVECKIV